MKLRLLKYLMGCTFVCWLVGLCHVASAINYYMPICGASIELSRQFQIMTVEDHTNLFHPEKYGGTYDRHIVLGAYDDGNEVSVLVIRPYEIVTPLNILERTSKELKNFMELLAIGKNPQKWDVLGVWENENVRIFQNNGIIYLSQNGYGSSLRLSDSSVVTAPTRIYAITKDQKKFLRIFFFFANSYERDFEYTDDIVKRIKFLEEVGNASTLFR